MEKYRDRKKDLHMIFIDLEKSYDMVFGEVLWWYLERKEVANRYIDLIKICMIVLTSIRIVGGKSGEFPITIGLHQSSTLSLYLFAFVMYELTKYIQDQIRWCMLFADDVVLVDESREGTSLKLEMWRNILDAKDFKLSRVKTKYLECNFGNKTSKIEGGVKLDDTKIGKSRSFRYLGSIIKEDGKLIETVINRINAG